MVNDLTFDTHSIHSLHFWQLFCQLTSPKVNLTTQPYTLLVLDKFPHNKKPWFSSSLKPDLKSRKVLIYSCFYAFTFLSLTAILPSPHGMRASGWCLVYIFRFVRSREQFNSVFYGGVLFEGTGQWFLSVRENKSIHGIYFLSSPVAKALTIDKMHRPNQVVKICTSFAPPSF